MTIVLDWWINKLNEKYSIWWTETVIPLKKMPFKSQSLINGDCRLIKTYLWLNCVRVIRTESGHVYFVSVRPTNVGCRHIQVLIFVPLYICICTWTYVYIYIYLVSVCFETTCLWREAGWDGLRLFRWLVLSRWQQCVTRSLLDVDESSLRLYTLYKHNLI